MGRYPSRVIFLGLALVTALTAPVPGAPSRSSLEGEWETLVASPRRPWNFTLRFVPAADGWAGTLRFPGYGDFPLRDVRAEGSRIHFEFPPELDSLPFEGTLDESTIDGHVVENGALVLTRLTRVVPLPPPASRDDAWRQDLDEAAARLVVYDRSFSPTAREECRRALERLKLEVPIKRDDEILVALSHAVALADNAHTRLRLDPTSGGTFSTELPLRVWWFDDGPFVLKAAPEYRRAVGCRVIAVDGHPISEVKAAVDELFAGNESWDDYLAPIYFTNPDVLYGLGLTGSRERVRLTFEDASGSRFELSLSAVSRAAKSSVSESWQDLSPLTRTGSPPWPSAIDPDASALPLYLRHPEHAYWFEFLPERQMLYFQFNRSGDAGTGPSFREFGDSLLAFTRTHEVRDLVIDLRLNSGGNLDVAREFMRNLGKDARLNRPGHLFAIVGHCTFSAGLYHAAQLKQFTHAIFVGEPVGDRLDFWAEGGAFELPNSHASIRYSNGFHRYSTASYPQNLPYYEELTIPTLAPDLRTPLRSTDYFAGRDPALEAIMAQVPHGD